MAHTKYFRNVDEVEYVFGLTLNMEQRLMAQLYITSGVRPTPDGCWTCSPAYIRKLTGKIDRYELSVDSGEEKWPWPESEPDKLDHSFVPDGTYWR